MPGRRPHGYGGRIVAVTGTLFLFDLFLPWHRTCVEVFTQDLCRQQTGWSAPFSLLAGLLVIALLADLVALRLADFEIATLGRVRLETSAAVVLLVLVQCLAGDDDLDRGYGIFSGLLLAVLLAYGTYLRTAAPATPLAATD